MRHTRFRFEISRREAWTVATLLLLVLLATHPELRLLMPLVDAVGVDTLLLIFGLQVMDLLGPLPLFARERLAVSTGWIDRATSSIAWLRGTRDFVRYALFHWVDARFWHWLHGKRLALQQAAVPNGAA